MLAELYTKTYVKCPDCSGESGHTVSQLFNIGYREFGSLQCVRCRGFFKGNVGTNNVVSIETATVTKAEMSRFGFTEQKGKHYEKHN